MEHRNIEERILYQAAFNSETKGLSKKAKKSFEKCVKHEANRHPVRDRLKKKLLAKKTEGW